ncbi:acidic repeat-containing protein-like [Pecten maximus]|uniref:acidic repeat-containing protein-like n=1 Tax=Pecten maximus TaxID=6579 RepID=UPI001458A529|nr:acidic repeat-containing protein-like [Pecten maximus]
MNMDFSLICLAFMSVVSFVSSMSIPLTNVLTKTPHTTCIRSCREVKTRHGVDDYTCGFSCLKIRGKVLKKRSKRDTKSSGRNYIHITPIPKKFKFYDINDDKGISLPEFARSLGHDPKSFHIRSAFSEVDRDSDGKIDAMEFHSDVLVFDGDGMFEDDDYNVDDSVISKRVQYDEDDGVVRNDDDSSDDSSSSDSSDDDDSSDSDSSDSDSSDSSDSSDDSDDSSKDSDDSSSDSSDSSDEDDKQKRKRGDRDDTGDDSRDRDDGFDLPEIRVKDDKFDDTADDMLENVLEGIDMDVGDIGIGGISANTDDIVDDLGDGISDAVENVNEVVGDAVDTFTDGAGDVIDNIQDGVENTIEAVSDVAGNMADSVSDVAGNVQDVISDVVENTVDTMSDVAGNVVDTVNDVMSDGSDAMNTMVAANLIAEAAPPSIIPNTRVNSRPQATLAGANRRLDIPPAPVPAVALPSIPNSPGVPSMWEDPSKGSADLQRNIANVVSRSNGGRTSVIQTARDDSIQWRF